MFLMILTLVDSLAKSIAGSMNLLTVTVAVVVSTTHVQGKIKHSTSAMSQKSASVSQSLALRAVPYLMMTAVVVVRSKFTFHSQSLDSKNHACENKITRKQENNRFSIEVIT